MALFSRKSNIKAFKVVSEYGPDNVEFPVCKPLGNGPDRIPWDEGVPLPRIEQPVQYSVDRDLPLLDFMITYDGSLLFSEKFCDIVESNSSCAVSYPAVVLFEGKEHRQDCRVLNFEKSFHCLDRKKSRIELLSPSSVEIVTLIALKEDAIPNEAIFRLGESPVDIIATEGFVKQVKSSGVSGVGFDPVSIYR